MFFVRSTSNQDGCELKKEVNISELVISGGTLDWSAFLSILLSF